MCQDRYMTHPKSNNHRWFPLGSFESSHKPHPQKGVDLYRAPSPMAAARVPWAPAGLKKKKAGRAGLAVRARGMPMPSPWRLGVGGFRGDRRQVFFFLLFFSRRFSHPKLDFKPGKSRKGHCLSRPSNSGAKIRVQWILVAQNGTPETGVSGRKPPQNPRNWEVGTWKRGSSFV